MKLTFKQKLEIVNTLKNDKIDLAEIEKYLSYMETKSLVPLIFEKLIDSLVEYDSYISAIYENISDEDWDEILSECDTPIENPLYGTIREKIRTFVNSYLEVEKILKNVNINVILECFKKICHSKTTSIQFLFFRLGLHRPRPVLYFFLNNIEINPTIYIPYFSSFVVRCDIDTKDALIKYIEYIKRFKKCARFNYILSVQSLIYICCFKKEYIEYCKDIFEYVFTEKHYRQMNPFVVETFCSIFGYDFNPFKSTDNFYMHFFPFDKTPFEKIHELYRDKYIEFKKSEEV